VIDGLNRAAENPEIKNVVLDVSCNRGGSADMVVAVMSLIADASDFSTENLLTGRVETQRYRVDRNFDGVFDDRDAAVRYDFRFGALTSRYSFSCGNLLPALMRDQGMAVLGETSGGGTCAVEKHAAPEGFVYQFSSGLGRLVDAQGQPIDGGIIPDIPLDEKDFYSLKALSRAMNDFYAR
jgi:C-terminal processing protease CtpA/Prc